MTTKPDTAGEGSKIDRTRWKLPPHVWHPSARRAWLEAAERAWSEGYAERFERGRLQRIVLKLLYWRGIEAPPDVKAKVFVTTDLEPLRILLDRAFEVTDPADLFIPEGPA
ncbi:hypothetical protein [Streptomyces sp. NBC_01483]|uniref:hypothetical protein n=1 Tax=Streptomyces sp. NBC_01483 TaxID=2903883 RepID=UPI002E3495D3|nr:hypothetical protein [Streptomyces sp. NBC_01483]